MAVTASEAARWQAYQTRARMGAQLWTQGLGAAFIVWILLTTYVVWHQTTYRFPGLGHPFFFRWMLGSILMRTPGINAYSGGWPIPAQGQWYALGPFTDWLNGLYAASFPGLFWYYGIRTAAVPIVLAAGAIAYRVHRRHLTDGEHLRGLRLLSPRDLNRQLHGGWLTRQYRELIARSAEPPGITIGGITLPRKLEREQFIILGSTGSGKSTVNRHLLYQVRDRGDSAIIHDPDREYVREFYDESRGDFVLNPVDIRCPFWTPWFELRDQFKPIDAAALAASIIRGRPQNDTQEYFQRNARALVRGMFEAIPVKDRDNLEVFAHFLKQSRDTLREQLEKTSAPAAIIDPGAHDSGGGTGIIGVTDAAIEGFGYMPRRDQTNRLWSAREWAANPRGSLAEVEACALARQHGGQEYVVTGNVVAAAFNHLAARPAENSEFGPDPQLHTHVVMLNMTKRPDGEHRSLDPIEIYRSQTFGGAVYLSELAREVQKLGYRVEATDSKGGWEIAGYSREQVMAFSQRSQEIEQRMKEEGWEGPRAARWAALETRMAKGTFEESALKTEWRERAEQYGIDAKTQLWQALGRGDMNLGNETDTRAALDFAKRHTTERDAVIDRRELEAAALRHSMGRVNLATVRAEIAREEQRGILIPSIKSDWQHAKGAFTTDEMVRLETENLAMRREGIGQAQPWLDLGHSSFVLAHLLGAEYHDVGDPDSTPLCPLALLDRPTGLQYLMGWFERLFFRRKEFELDEEGSKDLREALMDVRGNKGWDGVTPPRHLRRLYTALRTGTAQRTRMRSILDEMIESYGYIFGGEPTDATNNRITVYELSNLDTAPKYISTPAKELLLYNTMIGLNGKPGWVIWDEFWDAIGDDTSSAWFFRAIRTMRRMNCGFVGLTQSSVEITDSPYCNLLLGNMPGKLFFPDHSADTPIVATSLARLGLNPHEVSRIAGAHTGEFFYKSQMTVENALDCAG
jgi:hypothetical protein